MDSGLSPSEETAQAAPILTVVEDLIFLSKIRQTAREVGVLIEPTDLKKVKERILSRPARAVIVDLNHRSGNAVEAARAIKTDPATAHVQVLGFLSHVQTDLARAARAAGLDQVLARSAFTRELPDLLRKLAKR
jgi:DNA-binding NarL/FixJ family response regulator